jgi:methylthioribose-1-phosphate isomerase
VIRLADIARFDRGRGVVLALDWRAGVPPRELDLADADEVAGALADGLAADSAEAARLVCLGLALTARAWAGRPSDARRGAAIQAGERLRAAMPMPAGPALATALARADAALVAGEDAEAALLAYAGELAHSADRAAERCGRRAADLLDAGEAVLALPLGARALGWALQFAASQGSERRLYLPGDLAETVGARRLAQRAARLNVTIATVGAEPSVELAGVCLAEAVEVALDGGAALAPGAARAAEAAHGRMPLYALAPDGPGADREAPGMAADLVPPELISAIVTSRGLYRPAMIARHLGDGDTPLDVIPLR